MPETRTFPIAVVLSVTARLQVDLDPHMDILRYLTGVEPSRLTSRSACEACTPWIIEQYPLLGGVTLPDRWAGVTEPPRKDYPAMDAWAAGIGEVVGQELTLAPLPQGRWEPRSDMEELLGLVDDPGKVWIVDPPPGD